jgi:hypothetical protein
MHKSTLFNRILFALLLTFFSFGASLETQAADKKGLVIQVSEDNPKVWNQALNVARNIRATDGVFPV